VPGPALRAEEGDRSDTVAAVQFLLNCNGADIAVDGVFGPGTRAAVEAAQEQLGVAVDGIVGNETIAALSRGCSESRPIEGEGEIALVGNADPNDPELFALALVEGTTLTVTAGTAFTITLTDADGSEVVPESRGTWIVPTSGEYLLELAPSTGPANFEITLDVAAPQPELGDWILATDGITYGDTTLAIGDNADTVIDHVFDFLGHGIRGRYDEFDTGWVDEPDTVGLRGIFIEGLRFLFFGPHPGEPDRAETLERIRFQGPTLDAGDEPRPEHYVTTAEGVTVGDTLVELLAAYGDDVRAGSNDEEYYYRYTDSGGELCFYFDTEEEPDDLSVISEMATECRN
jgi:hypothetical protein